MRTDPSPDSPLPMTPAAALRRAAERVSQVHRITPNGWGYNVWDERRRAWWCGHATPYHQAVKARAVSVAAHAYALLSDDPDAYVIGQDRALEVSGSARARLAHALRRCPPRVLAAAEPTGEAA